MMDWSLWEARLRPRRVAARLERLAALEPVVVMGRGKSGTRLVVWAIEALGLPMATHPGVRTGDPADRAFRETVKRLAGRELAVNHPEQVPRADILALARAAERLWRRVRRRPGAGLGWGWKWPETYLIPECVYRVFPRARFLHVVRDGRELAFNRHLTDDPRRRLGRAVLRHLDALALPHHLQAAHSWAYQVERYRRFAGGLPAAQRFETSYEALCRDPAGEMERVAGFLGVPMTAACRDYVRAEFRARPPAWRRADPARVREVEAAVGDTLRALGYPVPVDAAS